MQPDFTLVRMRQHVRYIRSNKVSNESKDYVNEPCISSFIRENRTVSR